VDRPNLGVRGGIIADEMGLGKTILMVGCVRHNFKQRTLVVLPPALLSQWVAVFQRFLGHLPFVYRGAAAKNITNEI
jgi:SNF2 family DNA or RNA helicase